MSKILQNAIDQWKLFNKYNQFSEEFEKSILENDEKKLNKLYLTRLEFGTAGLRGRMGAGFSCMNDVVVIQAAQGLLEYILKTINDVESKGILIGYDGRHLSRRFAELTAAIFVQADVKVYLFSELCPTPFIPFGIKLLNAAAGVMVTASHNPKDDNGYKVYWENATQIISPHDKGISQCIMNNLEPRESSWETEHIESHPLNEDPLATVMQAYITRQLGLTYDLNLNKSSDIQFTYTAMHGVGYSYIKKPLIPVVEQIDPDPEFPTVKFPNPEEGKSALNLSFETADRNHCSLVLANDPDADRFAIAEKLKSRNTWKIFTGNETGALLGWWLLENYRKKNPSKNSLSDVYFISSTVSSKILKTIAQVENLSYEETLTGFKWMGNRADALIKEGKTVLFAFEESIGFMCDSECLDKDGISAAARMAELIFYINQAGQTLSEKLQEIYSKYGQHLYCSSYFFCYDKDLIKKIFNRIRSWNGTYKSYPESIADGKYKIVGVRDLTAGFDSNTVDKKPILPVSKSSEMITFHFENGFICTLRTSGTEPKIKYYSELISSPNEKDISKLQELLKEMVSILVEDFLQPELNKLISKND